jgi:hypothetical protein
MSGALFCRVPRLCLCRPIGGVSFDWLPFSLCAVFGSVAGGLLRVFLSVGVGCFVRCLG